jgi:hypothetical protein
MLWQPVLTLLTMVGRFSIPALILIVRLPARPSRVKNISMPSIRRNVCARRSRPARAPGFFGQPALCSETTRARPAATRRRSEAVPAQLLRSHANRHRVRLDDPLNCGSAVHVVGVCKGACGPQGWLGSSGPQSEIGHPRQARETNISQGAQASDRGVKQRAQDAGSRDFELAPKLGLGAPLLLTNWSQRQKNAAIGQIRSADDILDAIHQQRARRLKQHLFIVRVELPHRETATAREPTERIREPGGQAGEVIECEHIAVVAIISSRSSRGSARTGATLGSIRALSIFDRTVLAEPCSPDIANNG